MFCYKTANQIYRKTSKNFRFERFSVDLGCRHSRKALAGLRFKLTA